MLLLGNRGKIQNRIKTPWKCKTLISMPEVWRLARAVQFHLQIRQSCPNIAAAAVPSDLHLVDFRGENVS